MKKIGVLLLTLLILLSALALPVSAEGGGFGSGGGSGGGKDKPLSVEKTVPAEGESHASGFPIIFTFSKNTAHSSVKENNATLFSFTDEEGKEIPFTVEIPDEQIEPDRRNDILITSDIPLEDAKTYHIVAKAGIGSKSEEALAEDYPLTFVAEVAKEEPKEELKEESKEKPKEEAKQEASVPSTSTPSQETAPAPLESERVEEEETKESSGGIPPIAIGGGVVVLVAILVLVVRKKKTK